MLMLNNNVRLKYIRKYHDRHLSNLQFYKLYRIKCSYKS